MLITAAAGEKSKRALRRAKKKQEKQAVHARVDLQQTALVLTLSSTLVVEAIRTIGVLQRRSEDGDERCTSIAFSVCDQLDAQRGFPRASFRFLLAFRSLNLCSMSQRNWYSSSRRCSRVASALVDLRDAVLIDYCSRGLQEADEELLQQYADVFKAFLKPEELTAPKRDEEVRFAIS